MLYNLFLLYVFVWLVGYRYCQYLQDRKERILGEMFGDICQHVVNDNAHQPTQAP